MARFRICACSAGRGTCRLPRSMCRPSCGRAATIQSCHPRPPIILPRPFPTAGSISSRALVIIGYLLNSRVCSTPCKRRSAADENRDQGFSLSALLGPWLGWAKIERKAAEPPDLHLVVGQAAAVLPSVLAQPAEAAFDRAVGQV